MLRYRFPLHSIKSSRFFHSIPIVDVSPFTDSNPANVTKEEKRKSSELLHDACANVGFVYLKGHGIPEEYFTLTRDYIRSFFLLPEKTKEAINISNSKSYRGYQRVGQSITEGKMDVLEAFDLSREYDEKHPYSIAGYPLIGMNQWPLDEDIPGFRQHFLDYASRMNQLGVQVMRALAMGIELEEHYFDSYFSSPHWMMRLIAYPPVTKPIGNDFGLGSGAHSDYGCLTFINQDDVKGTLQVQNIDNEWINADKIEGTMVMNIGDMIEVWTNGAYRSTLHRVVSPKSQETTRISAPFFFDPNYTACISPLGKFSSNETQPPIYYADHVRMKQERNFVL